MLLGVAVRAAAGQQAHLMPQLPIAALERSVTLRDGIASTHDEVTTQSADAQPFYDQGLTYLHHFAWIEAARSFNQAARLDPDLAPAYVGLSLAYRQIGSGRMAQAALDDGLGRFPRNVELWLARGVAESGNAADRGQGVRAASIPSFEKALELRPDHFAAHHYLAHAYENEGRSELALNRAERYATLAPEVAPARHMRGHDLRRLGRFKEAIAEFGEATWLTGVSIDEARRASAALARAAFERARGAWRDADPELRELKEIDARMTTRAPAQAGRQTPSSQTGSQPRPDQILFLDVPATAPWTDTGISVKEGDRIQIRARGMVGFDGPAAGRKAPPAGSADPAGGCEFVVVDGSVPAHSLVGNIAPGLTYDGKGFAVGPSWDGAVPVPGASAESGRLFLGFNDRAMLCDRSGYDSWGFRVANSGSFSIELSITRH